MTKLTDTQLAILSSAAQRHDHGVLLPERLKGQAARNTVERLISRGLVEEVEATGCGFRRMPATCSEMMSAAVPI
jgi:hypothetical protein